MHTSAAIFTILAFGAVFGSPSLAWNMEGPMGEDTFQVVESGKADSPAASLIGYNGEMMFPREYLLESALMDGSDRKYVQHKRSADDRLYRLCGVHLYNMIKMVCVKQMYNKGKRSTGLDDFSLGVENSNNGWSGTPSVLERFQTTSLIGHRTKRGASTDCCSKPCTLSHLATFC